MTRVSNLNWLLLSSRKSGSAPKCHNHRRVAGWRWGGSEGGGGEGGEGERSRWVVGKVLDEVRRVWR